MGSADSKAKCDKDSQDYDSQPEEILPFCLSAAGIRVHQIDHNNYLGRLQDAERFSQLSLWHRLLMLLGKRTQQLLPGGSAAHPTPALGTVESVLVEQQERQQQEAACCSPCSTVTAGAATSGSQHQRGCSHECSGSGAASTAVANESSTEVTRQDLTTLLRQGFDPAAYNKRLQLARFTNPEKFGLNPREV